MKKETYLTKMRFFAILKLRSIKITRRNRLKKFLKQPPPTQEDRRERFALFLMEEIKKVDFDCGPLVFDSDMGSDFIYQCKQTLIYEHNRNPTHPEFTAFLQQVPVTFRLDGETAIQYYVWQWRRRIASVVFNGRQVEIHIK